MQHTATWTLKNDLLFCGGKFRRKAFRQLKLEPLRQQLRTKEQRRKKRTKTHQAGVRGELSDSGERLGTDGHTVRNVQSRGFRHERLSKNRSTGHQIQKVTDRKTNRLTHGNRIDTGIDDSWSGTWIREEQVWGLANMEVETHEGRGYGQVRRRPVKAGWEERGQYVSRLFQRGKEWKPYEWAPKEQGEVALEGQTKYHETISGGGYRRKQEQR